MRWRPGPRLVLVAVVVVAVGVLAATGRLLAIDSSAAPTELCRNTLEAVHPGRYLAGGAPSSPDAWSPPARAFSRSVAS
jgi:hypothetical protein